MTAAAAAALAQYCPDLQEWPERWMGDEPDIAVGQRIVEFFKPFLLHMISEKLATKTLHRHRDHLWLLGGELIKRRYDDHPIKRMAVEKAIVLLIQADEGPLIWPSITEAQQESFDATCRKFYKFLNSAKKPAE